MRLTSIHEVRPITSEIDSSVGGTKAATTSSRKTWGKQSIVSTKRISSVSAAPPR